MQHIKNIRVILFVLMCALLSFGVPKAVSAADLSKLNVQSLGVVTVDAEGAELRYPGSVYYSEDRDEVFVVDSGKDQLVAYTLDYFPKTAFGKGRGIQKIHSCYVSLGQTYVLVGDVGSKRNGRILQFNEAFFPVKEIAFSGFTGADAFIPREMVLGKDGRFYVAGVDSPGLVVMDASGGFLRIIQPWEEVLGVKEKVKVNSVVRDGQGRLYLLSEEMGKVYVYDADENFLFRFGQKGGVQGKLSRPRGIAVDDRGGRIFIVDFMRHSVAIYSLSGEFLSEFGGMGSERGWFYFPSDVALDRMGRLWVADTFNQRVQVFGFDENSKKIQDSSTSKENTKDTSSSSSLGTSSEPSVDLTETDTNREEAIRKTISAWKGAWEGKDVNKYLSQYADEFDVCGYFSHYNEREEGMRPLTVESGNPVSHADWERFRRKRLTEPAFIELVMDGVNIRPLKGGESVLVSFHQLYRSDLYEDDGYKSLILKKRSQGWVIVEEHFAQKKACCLSGGCIATPSPVGGTEGNGTSSMKYESMCESG